MDMVELCENKYGTSIILYGPYNMDGRFRN